jgi:hypothetical protein
MHSQYYPGCSEQGATSSQPSQAEPPQATGAAAKQGDSPPIDWSIFLPPCPPQPWMAGLPEFRVRSSLRCLRSLTIQGGRLRATPAARTSLDRVVRPLATSIPIIVNGCSPGHRPRIRRSRQRCSAATIWQTHSDSTRRPDN